MQTQHEDTEHEQAVVALAEQGGNGTWPLCTPAYRALLERRAVERALSMLTQELPTHASGAALQLHVATGQWERAAMDARAATTEWARHDMKGSSVRVQCTKALMAGGMAATPADKAASDHPDYQAHKAEAFRLAEIKDAAVLDADMAKARMENAREYLRMLQPIVVNNATV